MKKELPYFKWNPSKWETGNISYEDEYTQFAFMKLCNWYWLREGNLTINEAKKRLKNDAVFEILTKEYIQIIGENIEIKWLREQLNSFENMSKINAVNGKKGGRPEGTKKAKKTDRFFLESETKAKKSNIEKEKEKEEEKDKEKNNTNYNTNNNSLPLFVSPTGESVGEKKEILKVKNSKYGDGELHQMCIDYDQKNKGKYSKEFYQDFLEYWTAPIQKGAARGRELWRDSKAFALGSRLATSFRVTQQIKMPNGQNTRPGKITAAVEMSNWFDTEILGK